MNNQYSCVSQYRPTKYVAAYNQSFLILDVQPVDNFCFQSNSLKAAKRVYNPTVVMVDLVYTLKDARSELVLFQKYDDPTAHHELFLFPNFYVLDKTLSVRSIAIRMNIEGSMGMGGAIG